MAADNQSLINAETGELEIEMENKNLEEKYEELLKEIELISQVQSTLTKTLQQTRDQIEACKEAKHRLEMDWSDKYTAQGLGRCTV